MPKAGRRRLPSGRIGCDGNALSDEQRAVQAIGGDGVRGREDPAGEDRLHQLEPVRDPFDAAEQLGVVHGSVRRRRHADDDFRLDARLGEARQREARRDGGELVNRRVVDMAPDRRVDAVLIPDPPVGEPDLAADRPLSARHAALVHESGNAIGGGEVEAGVTRTEGANLPTRAEDREDLRGCFLDVDRAHDGIVRSRVSSRSTRPRVPRWRA